MTLPTILYAGDTLSFVETIADYSNDDGYSAFYLLNSSANSYSVTSSASGTTYTFSETSTNTALWVAGKYTFLIYASKSGIQYTVERGEIEIKANLVAGAVDIRTHAQKVLDSINTVLEGRASEGYENYNLPGGVSISKASHMDLLKFKKSYEQIRRQEIKEEDILNGKTAGNIIKVRF